MGTRLDADRLQCEGPDSPAARHRREDPADKEPPRRITGVQYRRDNVGFLVENHEQVFLVWVAGGEAAPAHDRSLRQLGATWSPDGGTLAFVSARNPQDDTLLNDVFTLHPDGTDLRRVTDTSLDISQVRFTSDGTSLLLVACDYGPGGDDWVAAQAGMFTVPLATGGSPRRLTDEERVSVTDAEMVVVGDRVLVAIEDRGAVDLLAASVTGDAHRRCCRQDAASSAGFDALGDTTVVWFSDTTSCGELGVLDGTGIVRLTDFGATLRSETTLFEQIELSPNAPDGQQLHGFLVLPEGDGPHPVLLMIHGGPFSQYTWSVFDEAQVYAGAGYAVVYTNPRGSSGYGQAYGRYIIGDVGERSSIDLLTMLDAALERTDLNAGRVGVLGGSHGGFMTSWLVGHTGRFKAAVSERAVNAIDSFTGSSDIGWVFADTLYGSDQQQQHEQSPLTHADHITTPLLIIHSEQDWRCPLEQAQRLYVALKQRHATVELLLFPGEGHELSRSGLPSHRVARFDAILSWFAEHLH